MAGSATSNAARTVARALAVERGATRANPNLFELSSALEAEGSVERSPRLGGARTR